MTDKAPRKDPDGGTEDTARLLSIHRAMRAIARAAEEAEHAQELLDAACGALAENLGYRHAWAAVLDKDNALQHVASHPEASPFSPLLELMCREDRPVCMQAVLEAGAPIRLGAIKGICETCPAQAGNALSDAWAAPMRFRGRAPGLLIALDHGAYENEAERTLLMDAAAEMGAGLHRLEEKKARAQAENRFERLVNHIMGMVYQCRNDGHWTMHYLSEGAFNLTGYRPEQLLHNRERSYEDVIHPDDREHVRGEVQAAIQEQRPFVIRYRILRADGVTRWVDERGHTAPDGASGSLRLEGLVTDVTEQVEREEALLETTRELEGFFDVALDLFVITDRDGRVLKLNRQWESVLGYPRERLQGALLLDFVHPDDLEATIEAMSHAAENKPVLDFVNRYRCADGSYRYIEWRAHPHGDINFAAARDVTLRQAREAELRHSEARFRLLIESAPEAIFVQTSGRFAYLNQTACTLFGAQSAEQLLGQPVIERIHPDFHNAVRERMQRLNELREAVPILEEEIVRLDGGTVPVEIKAVPITYKEADGALVFMSDLTPRKVIEQRQRKLEEQLQQSQKMESVGRLAGGVAHDFNNLLVPILGHAELLVADLAPHDARREPLQEILGAAERASGVASQLLTFSRIKPMAMVPVNLNAIVQGFQRMLGRLIGADVDLILDMYPNSLTIEGDPGQLEQVLLNLAVNARDAMPDGGHLRIETSMVDIDDAYITERPSVRPGRYALLAVSDDGVGMDAATRQRIFDPFFTTKESDKGTGLGLSTVYGIVKQHGGHIWVYSEVGHGTTFRVYFPLAKQVASVTTTQSGAPADQEPPLNGPACVLVLEDLEPVRKLVVLMLTRQGHTVLEAQTVAEAHALAAATPDIDLMISDVILPDGKGPEAYEMLCAQHPGMRIVYMSGYTENAVVKESARAGLFLQKPFTAKTLETTVARALAAPPPNADD